MLDLKMHPLHETVIWLIVGRGVVTSYFMKAHPILHTYYTLYYTLYYLYYPHFQIFPPLPHPYCRLQPLPQLLFRLSSFFGYMVDPNTFDVLLYLMLLWIYTCQALVHFKTKRPSYILKKSGKKDFLWQKV